MRVLIQRVLEGSVDVGGETTGSIDRGLVLLVGVAVSDTNRQAMQLAAKIANLRIFEDDQGAMNRSLLDLLLEEPGSARVLSISQFTLYADCRKGRRPSFTDAARPETALPLFEQFNTALAAHGIPVEIGVFGAEMKVHLVNDGPVTIWLDSAELGRT